MVDSLSSSAYFHLHPQGQSLCHLDLRSREELGHCHILHRVSHYLYSCLHQGLSPWPALSNHTENLKRWLVGRVMAQWVKSICCVSRIPGTHVKTMEVVVCICSSSSCCKTGDRVGTLLGSSVSLDQIFLH